MCIHIFTHILANYWPIGVVQYLLESWSPYNSSTVQYSDVVRIGLTVIIKNKCEGAYQGEFFHKSEFFGNIIEAPEGLRNITIFVLLNLNLNGPSWSAVSVCLQSGSLCAW